MKDLLEKIGIEQENLGACAGPEDWFDDPEAQELVSINPTTGEPIAAVRQATEKTYDRVVSQAAVSFKKWRMMPAPSELQPPEEDTPTTTSAPTTTAPSYPWDQDGDF